MCIRDRRWTGRGGTRRTRRKSALFFTRSDRGKKSSSPPTCLLYTSRPSGLEVLSGDRGALADTRYVITLDSDTSLNVGAAWKMPFPV